MAELPEAGKFITNDTAELASATILQVISDASLPITVHKKPVTSDCQNCGYDNARKASNRQYNASNPNPSGPLNEVFPTGGICPVCNGKGKLNTTQNETIRGAKFTNLQELRDLEREQGYVLNSTAKIFTTSDYYSLLSRTEKITIQDILYKRISEPLLLGLTESTQDILKVIYKVER